MASPGVEDDGGNTQLFAGVHFVLVGFDPVSESQYRAEMVRRGGADAGRFGSRCTHVVACGLVYDDPMCVAARAKGNKVVSELWVDDSLDRGDLADADRVIYWPVRDLNGIPGSESLQICLTGYQRNDREDIMKMVSLMGAQFSKPLVGNVVTHLICYKFEGEKYELAKRMNIKLVNHRWLEDCLKSWEILPVNGYSKSGWQLEIMEAQAKDSEDEAEDVDQKPFNRSSSSKCTPNPKSKGEAYVNPDVNAPIRSTIVPSGDKEMDVERHLNTQGQIRNGEDAANRTHDITAQGILNTSMLAISANTDVGAPLQTPIVLDDNRGDGAVRNSNSPNQIRGSECKDGGTRTYDTTRMAISSNHHFHSSNETPTIPNGNADNVARKRFESHGHIDRSKAHMTTPPRESWSANFLDSSHVDKEQHQEVDGVIGNLVAVAAQSNIDDKLADHEFNSKLGNASSNDINNLSYFRNTLHKSLSPEEAPVHQTTSPQRAEGSTLRIDSNILPFEKGDQKFTELADIRNLKEGGENVKNVNGLDGAYAHKKKCSISPASLKSQNGDPVSETVTLNSPFMSRLSDTSEPAITSHMLTNPTEATTVGSRKQQSGSSKSKQSRSRSTSVKHRNPVVGVKLPEYSASNKNVESLPKERASVKAMAENKSTTSHSDTVQDGKRNPGFSFQNTDQEAAQASGSAANQHGLLPMHETENACTKDRTPDISLHSSRNSEFVPCCGNNDIEITDALDISENEAAATSEFQLQKVTSDDKVKASIKGLPGTSSNVLCETSYPKKVTTARAKNANAKRPRSTNMEVDESVVNNGQAVSEWEPDKMIACQDAGATSKDGCSGASATECNSPKKALVGGAARNTFAKRRRKVHTKVDNAQVASNLESGKVFSQENNETDPKKSSSNVNADEHRRNSPKKLPHTRVRNTVVKRSRKSDTNMTDEYQVDKAETVATKSLFDDLCCSGNDEECSKKLSSSASADGIGSPSPRSGSTDRVRKVVAKRKMKDVEDQSGSKLNKIGSAIVSAVKTVSSKRIEESAYKVTADQDCKKAIKNGTRDVSGLFCKDNITIDKSEGLHSSKIRRSTRNKAPASDHEKENRQKLFCEDTVTLEKSELHNSNLRCSTRKKAPASDHEKENRQELFSEDTVTHGNSGQYNSMLRCGTRNKAPVSDHEKENGRELFCEDTVTVHKPGPYNPKLRCSTRNKAAASDHEKVKQQDRCNLTSKSKGSLISKFSAGSTQKNTNILVEHGRMEGNGTETLVTMDPSWFILSGHRQQRRDYRSILRRLKGRVCRDSHHWSYQATHFIAPDPLRRTEKFFAAAASGRWILKSDYLTSCNEAGKFLDEEQFEWFGTGLNDGETISLEAPRKWRVLRQQMGHGAFYGMQIIVYGQLISPSLDTLKRAVRAGDGTILATSPPYTRFLNSGVDFAVVSASMPKADAWIQEFTNYDIPCVSADYLVEYVCKPGYPLDKHVLYKTNRLANKSLDKLLKNQQEVAKDKPDLSEDEDPEDLRCSVCERTDRGEVMLICGDEDGSTGCGIGMHIDCCDPPLDEVPEGDWLCPKCDVSKAKKKPTRGTASRSRGSKRR